MATRAKPVVLPSRVKIGPVKYNLTLRSKDDPLLPDALLESDEDHNINKSAMGVSSFKDGFMAVRDFGNFQSTQDTVLHECIHMVQKQYGIRYIPNTLKNEELLATVWTQAILNLIKDNPQLIDYLRREE